MAKKKSFLKDLYLSRNNEILIAIDYCGNLLNEFLQNDLLTNEQVLNCMEYILKQIELPKPKKNKINGKAINTRTNKPSGTNKTKSTTKSSTNTKSKTKSNRKSK